MFIHRQSPEKQKLYEEFLKLMGSLSGLFSDSETPYLYYRAAERIFCHAFEAKDLSRGDVSADAQKEGVGIGLKTFLAGNHKTFQKIAEFNSDRPMYENLPTRGMVEKIAELRNARIDFTERTYGIDKSIYHCVIREKNKFLIFEESMDRIDIENISLKKPKKKSVVFEDGINEYSFLNSKSTLTKRFITDSVVYEFDVAIIDDPLEALKSLLSRIKLEVPTERELLSTIYLPLYGRGKKVYEKSGLNQWNAGGRLRDPNEVYIPIPIDIHRFFPSFFPPHDKYFELKLPNGNFLKSKICQDNGKALMSYSNRELGKWILREVLQLEERELLTYERLQILGIDSVRIDKFQSGVYEVNFSQIDSYEDFIHSFKN